MATEIRASFKLAAKSCNDGDEENHDEEDDDQEVLNLGQIQQFRLHLDAEDMRKSPTGPLSRSDILKWKRRKMKDLNVNMRVKIVKLALSKELTQ